MMLFLFNVQLRNKYDDDDDDDESTQVLHVLNFCCIDLLVGVSCLLLFYFLQSTAQLQYAEDSEPITRST